jgi:hypothetical protein
MKKYIDLGREFMPFKDEPDWELSYHTFLSDSYLGATSWPGLLKRRRIVILAEAGSGKTFELREKAGALTAAGTPAFYLTVNDVAAKGVATALGVADGVRFGAWLAGTGEGVIFLDSVDEARINGQSFTSALKALEAALPNAQQRVTIVVSCRVSDWRSLEDRSEFATIFGGPPPPSGEPSPPSPAGPNDAALLGPIFESPKKQQGDDGDEDIPQDFNPFIVALAPLTLGQAKRLAEWDGVPDPDKFIAAVRAADAEDLANRPQDLLALTAYWKDKKAIGSKRELLDWAVHHRLRETNIDLGDKDPISEEEAFEAAKVLATALTFGHKRFLAWPLDTPAADAADALSLNPKDVLKNFNGQKIKAILNRAIFDPATHGRVRFHHRSVQEYLCALWIIDQLNAGCPVRRVWQILAEQKYGEIRLRPALRPIAAWLAQLDDRIRRLVLPVAPDLLIEGGDPAILPLPVKERLLDHFARRYAGRDDAGISIGIDQVARLAEPGLDKKIRELWAKTTSGEVRELLLRLVWVGKISGCSGIALDAAISAKRPYQRALGARAVGEIGTTAERKRLAAHLLTNAKSYSARAIAPTLEAVFPSVLSLADLETILRRHPPDTMQDNHSGIIHGLQEAIRHETLPDPAGLAAMLVRLIRLKPWGQDRDRQYSQKFWTLAAPLLDLCAKLIRERGQAGLGGNLSSAAGLACNVAQHVHDYSIGKSRKEFAAALEGNAGANREQFWYSMADTRSRHGNLSGYWQADIYHDLWTVTGRDWDWLLEDLTKRPLPNDRLMALTALYELWVKGGRDNAKLAAIRAAIAGAADLEASLAEMISPPVRTPTERDIRWEQERAEAKARREESDNTAKASWVEMRDKLVEDHSNIVFGVLYDLSRWINRASGRDRYSHKNWRIMVEPFTEAVARGVRDAFVAFWRTYDPDPTVARRRAMTNGAQVGLIGLAIEAAETPSWVTQLSDADVRIATHYAILEMNGLPEWAPSLWLARPGIAEAELKREIRWEFDKATKTNHIHHVVSTIAYAKEPFRSLAAVWVLDELEKALPKSDHELFLALDLVVKAQGIPAKRLAALAASGYAAARSIERKLKWLSIWLAVDAAPAMAALDALLKSQKGAKKGAVVAGLLSMMFGSSSYNYGPTHQSFRTLDALRTLTTLAYRHIQPADDVRRAGVRSQTRRDDAEDARGAVLGMLVALPGEGTFRALREMSGEPEFAILRERLLVLAERRARDDANLPAWSPAQVIAFAKAHEKPPVTLAELDQVVCDRLWDIEDDMIAGRFTDKLLLRQDERKRVVERPVQLEIAKQLTLRSKGVYSVEREPEQSDYNEPDISIQRAGISQPVPVEIKVADSWNYNDLTEALSDQLIGKYMRSHSASHGHLVMTYHGKKKTWLHPVSGKRLDFQALVRSLQEDADAMVRANATLTKITVTGIDLTASTTND